MKYICDVPGGRTWFRLESEAEAERESARMQHGVAVRFHDERARAIRSYRAQSAASAGGSLPLERHVRIAMPIFLSLRDREDAALVTAMLAHGSPDHPEAELVIVGKGDTDPYPDHGRAIAALSDRLGIDLDRARCFPFATPGRKSWPTPAA